MDYIPLITHDYKVAFCQATNKLPELAQREIWNKVLELTEPECPPTPVKKPPRRLWFMKKRF